MHDPARHDVSEVPASEFTDDTLLDGKVRLRQPAAGYRAAIDPVFLAAAVPAGPGERVLDAGCGAGAAFLCLARRVRGCTVAGVERDAALAELARFNVRDNGFAERVEIHAGDIAGPIPGLAARAFDHVMINPPYLDPKRVRPSGHGPRAAAMVEGTADLATWLSFAHGMLRDGGVLTLIHRADRLDDVMAALTPRFGGIERFPLFPFSGIAAKRVIIRARKDSDEPAATLPGLILHGDDGRFTPGADEILRDGRALVF